MSNVGKGTKVSVTNAQNDGLSKAFETLAKPKSEELGAFDTQAGNNQPIEILQ